MTGLAKRVHARLLLASTSEVYGGIPLAVSIETWWLSLLLLLLLLLLNLVSLVSLCFFVQLFSATNLSLFFLVFLVFSILTFIPDPEVSPMIQVTVRVRMGIG